MFTDTHSRIQKAKKEVSAFKKAMLNPVQDYSEKYKRDIEEGTEKVKLLLEQGSKQGLSKEEILKREVYDKALFIPTQDTPILNFLYFIMGECEEKDPKYKLLNEEKRELDGDYAKEWYDKDQSFGAEKLEDVTKLMFNGIDLETFNKIKKLKKLAKSPNENEAFQSYRKCNELCDKYNLTFDKIPES